MSEQSNVITDPAIKKAFVEGFSEGMADILSGEEPAWLVEVRYDDTLLKQYRTTSAEKVLADCKEAVTNGCSFEVKPDRHGTVEAVTEAKDDEIVDAELVP